MATKAEKREFVADVFKTVIRKEVGVPAKRYSEELVPAAAPPKGFGADLGGWFLLLERIEKEFRTLGHKSLDLTFRDAFDTVSEPLSNPIDLVVDRI